MEAMGVDCGCAAEYVVCFPHDIPSNAVADAAASLDSLADVQKLARRIAKSFCSLFPRPTVSAQSLQFSKDILHGETIQENPSSFNRN